MNFQGKILEKGQAMIYLMIGMVVFLGFVALAIDGSMVLADRRHAQNAADAAALAGGGKAAYNLETGHIEEQHWKCGDVGFAMHNAEITAINRAGANNFVITNTYGIDHNFVDATCSNSGRYIDVTVEISATTPSNFLQMVFPGALHNEVEAVARVFPGYPSGFGNAIVALNDASCEDPGIDGGIVYSNQGANLNITGGGIFTNGCLRQNGNPDVKITDGDALYHDGMHLDPKNWDPDPITTTLSIEPADFKVTEVCPATDDAHNIDTPKKLNDLQKEIADASKTGKYTFESGLWCISGNLTINSNDKIEGNHITLEFRTGGLTINGTPDINISAPADNITPSSSNGLPGVLLYFPPPDDTFTNCPNHVVKLNGTETSTFTGMILAPCADITLNGTGGNTYVGQVIGWNVAIGGDADLDLTYHRNPFFDKPASMELHR
jgi:hypothetical protein